MTDASDVVPANRATARPGDAHDLTGWRTLDARALLVGRLAGAVATLVIAGVASVMSLGVALSGNLSWPEKLLALAAAAVAVVATGALAWVVPARRMRYTRYRLDDVGVLIRRGRLFHSEVAVLRTRIQHSDVSQGPLQRAFGLGTLTVYTAGTEHAEIRLSGVAFDEARRLRAELMGLGIDDAV
jgi:hypothetical protein